MAIMLLLLVCMILSFHMWVGTRRHANPVVTAASHVSRLVVVMIIVARRALHRARQRRRSLSPMVTAMILTRIGRKVGVELTKFVGKLIH